MGISRLSTAMQNALANRIGSLMAGGSMSIYTGDQPQSSNDGVGRSVLLVTLDFSSKAFSDARAGKIVSNEIKPRDAIASGEASWARLKDAAGAVLFDCDVGEKDATVILNSVDIRANGPVTIAEFSIEIPRG